MDHNNKKEAKEFTSPLLLLFHSSPDSTHIELQPFQIGN